MSETQHESMPGASVTNLGSFAFFTGMLLFTLATVAPPGFYMLKTGGALELIADFPALAAVLGTRYGGDGITTFGTPPAEYVLAGPHAGHPLWTLEGEETHQLTLDELASHTHIVGREVVSLTPGGTAFSIRGNQSAHDTPSDPAGGDLPHNNLQPTHRVNVIVKT